MFPNNFQEQSQDVLNKLFSAGLFEFRKIGHIIEGKSDEAFPVGPGSGGLLKYSDGSVKYDLRPYPEGPGPFGYAHPVIFKGTLEAKLSGRHLALEKEREKLWQSGEKIWQICHPSEREILKKSFLGPIFKAEKGLKKITYETYLISLGLLRLLEEGPILGPHGRIREIETWLDEYRGDLERKNLTISFSSSNGGRTHLFRRGIVHSPGVLCFPLCLLKEQIEEIFYLIFNSERWS